ncbi:MAG: alpha/beta hydrolase [Hyphomicrobiaceae bacterium]
MNAITQNRSIGGADLIAPILFIHGSLGSSAQWQETIDALNSDAPVMSIDLSGYGRNGPWLSERPISLAEEAMVVLRPLGRQVRRLHIVGHGFGAAVALKIAELWPERIASLVLIEPISVNILLGEGPSAEAARADFAAVASAVTEAWNDGRPGEGLELFTEFWNGSGAWAILGEDARQQLIARVPRLLSDFEACRGDAARAGDVAELEMPTTLVVGTDSPSTGRAVAEVLARAMPDANLKRIRGVGHMLPATHPELLAALLRHHFDNLEVCIPIAQSQPAAAVGVAA